MRSVDDRGSPPACPAAFNIASHVLWNNGAPDDRIAMAVLGATGAERWSYGRLRARVLAVAQGLVDVGLRPGDRLLMRLGNTPDFPVVFLAAVARDILPVPTSAALADAEFDRLADIVRPAAIVADCKVAGRAEQWLSPDALGAATPGEPPAPGDPDRPAYIVFTSGTSGRPMGVVHAHRAIWARRSMIEGWYDLRHTDRMLHAGAFNWTYTLGTGLLDPWAVGATALVLAEGTGPTLLPLLMKRHDATIFAAAPGVYRRLLKTPLPQLPKLRHGLSAGEKLPESIRQRWREATGTDIHEAFGQSECSTFISGSPGRPAPPGMLGFAQPGRRVAILDRNGPVGRREAGEIAIDAADPGVMLEYLDAPDATAARFRDGWFLTGDLGAMDEDGAVGHLGRTDDLLTAGGFRVAPAEVEAAMLEFPGVEDAAAIDERIDPETTIIALHYAAAAPLDEIALAAHASKKLARWKRPRRFHHHVNLPRGATGKLLRARLRAATDMGS